MTAFAQRLKELRQHAGLGQKRLAEAIGSDHSFISRLESGNRAPRRDTAERLAEVLNDRHETLLVAAGFLPTWLDRAIDAGNLDLVINDLCDLRAVMDRNPEKLAIRINLLTTELMKLAGGRHGQTSTRPRTTHQREFTRIAARPVDDQAAARPGVPGARRDQRPRALG